MVVQGDVTTYNDKYVVHYDFAGLERDVAIEKFKTLLEDLDQAGLDVEVRPGYEQTLLVFVKAPYELLGSTVYKSR